MDNRSGMMELEFKSNPLKNSVILRQIVNDLPFEDRKSFRGVCKYWRNESLWPWRSNVILSLNPKRMEEFFNMFCPDSPRFDSTLPLYNLEETPFLHFKVDATKTGVSLPPYDSKGYLASWKNSSFRHFNFLLETCGPTMETLSLEEVSFREGRVADSLQWLLLQHCSNNLRELTLIRPCFVWDQQQKQESFFEGGEVDEENIPARVAANLQHLSVNLADPCSNNKTKTTMSKEMIDFLPNMKKLTLNGKYLDNLIAALSQPLSEQNGDRQFVKLSELELNFSSKIAVRTQPDVFQMLVLYMKKTDPSLLARIKISSICLHSAQLPPYSFNQFLRQSKQTLTHLDLSFTFFPSQDTIWVSDLTRIYFPNLTHLTLSMEEVGGGSEEQRQTPIRFDFRGIWGMPKLQVFRFVALCGVCGNSSNDSEVGQIPDTELESGGDEFSWEKQLNRSDRAFASGVTALENLEEFRFYSNGKFSVNSLIKLAKWMPSVKKLGIVADKTTFLVIFEAWKNLENVALLNTLADISGFTIRLMEMIKKVRIELINTEDCQQQRF